MHAMVTGSYHTSLCEWSAKRARFADIIDTQSQTSSSQKAEALPCEVILGEGLEPLLCGNASWHFPLSH
jgi:hypothetical protein